MARRSPPRPFEAPPRPAGRLLWAHLPQAGRFGPVRHIWQRLRETFPALQLLVTTPEPAPPPPEVEGRDDVHWQTAPGEHPAEAEAFLAHWRPSAGLWLGGILRPALIHAAAEAAVPMHLAEARADMLEGWRWYPDLTRATLERFDAVMARDPEALRRLRRLGLPEARLTLSGSLQEAGVPLPGDEDALERTAAHLAGRPLWLAARLPEPELPMVLQAQRAACRLAHRLLLILTPAHADEGADYLRRVAAGGLRAVSHESGDLPDEHTQVLVAASPEEMGFWYRLAPLTLAGGTLLPPRPGRDRPTDPFEAASLGSALLHGPHLGPSLPAYARLAAAGAARQVQGAEELSQAVTQLIQPDQAAEMAHAAWEAASQGAEVTDELIEMLLDRLELSGGTE